MRRFELTDEQWEKIKHLLPGKEGDSGRTAKDNRLFVDAVLWTARTGAQWRDLPSRFGNWNSIYQRFNRWAKAGRWQVIFEQMQDPDLEWLLIDSTIVRAHQHAAGALKKGGDQALGRSRGGLGTKVHIACEGLGLPVRFLLTGGEVHDVTQASALMEGIPAEQVIADKGYDSDAVVARIEEQGGTAIIPSKSNRKKPRPLDRTTYQERNRIERLINRLKQCRRIATRYDKTSRNFLAFLYLAGTMLWLA